MLIHAEAVYIHIKKKDWKASGAQDEHIGSYLPAGHSSSVSEEEVKYVPCHQEAVLLCSLFQ